jgi:LPS-assembly lipoprotein
VTPVLRFAARWVLLAVAVLAAGCGFRLQGASQPTAGLDSVHVATRDRLTPFAVELGRGLQRAGADEAAVASEADAVVRVIRDRSGRRVLSVSARNTPQEFEIFYEVEYAIERGGTEVVPPQKLALTRNISFDESQLLAKDREEEILREAMARDLADLVLRRLESLPAAPPPAVPSSTEPGGPSR